MYFSTHLPISLGNKISDVAYAMAMSVIETGVQNLCDATLAPRRLANGRSRLLIEAGSW